MENFNTVPNKGTFGGSVVVINQNFSLAQQEMEVLQNKCENESARAIEAENSLRQLYNNLQQSKAIPVTSLPATGEAGKIYRLAGTNSYADYMYSESDLTTPIKMAEYDNAIDDKPTPESDNLVKSGGVHVPLASLSIQQVIKNKIEIEETLHGGRSIFIHDGNWIFRAYVNADYSSNSVFAEAMGLSLVTSPRGFANCIEIPDTKSLVLDSKTGTCSIKDRTSLDINDHILMSCSDGGVIGVDSNIFCIHYFLNERLNRERVECISTHLYENINAIENYSWKGEGTLNNSTFIHNTGKIRSIEKIPVNSGEFVQWNCGTADIPDNCVMLLYDISGNVIEWYSANSNSRIVEILPNCTHIQCSFVKGAENIGVFHLDGTPIYIPKTTEESKESSTSNVIEEYGFLTDGQLVYDKNFVAMAKPVLANGGDTIIWGCGVSEVSSHCCLVEYDVNGTITGYWASYQETRIVTLNANTAFVYASFNKDFDGKGLFANDGSILFIPNTGSEKENIKMLKDKSFGEDSNVYLNYGWDIYGKLVNVNGVCCTKEKVSISGATHLIWRCGDNTPNHNYATLLFFDSSDNILEWYSSNTINRVIAIPTGAVSFHASFKSEYAPASVMSIAGTEFFKPLLPSLQSQINNIQTSDIAVNRDKIDDFASIIGIANGNIESFMLFSDPHFYKNYENALIDPVNRNIMNRMFEYWRQTPTDFSICLGDWLTAHKKSVAIKALAQIDAIMNKGFGFKFYPVFGNHDNNYQGEKDETTDTSANDGVLTNQQMINLMFRKWGKMYYTFKGNNTRFFTFDTGIDWVTAMDSYKWEQIAWFANDLLTNNDQHLVLLMHIVENTSPTPEGFLTNVIPLAQNISLVAQAFNDKTQLTMNGVTYDFSGKIGTIHCIICGHCHYDAIGTLNSIPVYGITTTMDYEAYDLIAIDYDVKVLKSVRIGLGNNRTMNIL